MCRLVYICDSRCNVQSYVVRCTNVSLCVDCIQFELILMSSPLISRRFARIAFTILYSINLRMHMHHIVYARVHNNEVSIISIAVVVLVMMFCLGAQRNERRQRHMMIRTRVGTQHAFSIQPRPRRSGCKCHHHANQYTHDVYYAIHDCTTYMTLYLAVQRTIM